MTTRISILVIVSPLLVLISGIHHGQGAVIESWVRLYDGPTNGYDYPVGVAVDGKGDVVVTGNSGGSFYTAKYAGMTGALLWERRSSQRLNGYDEAAALAVDQVGNAIVTGHSFDGNKASTPPNMLPPLETCSGKSATRVLEDARPPERQ